MADLQTGSLISTRACVEELLSELERFGERFNSEPALARAREMTQVNGAIAQRQAAGPGGPRAVARWLTQRFLA